MLSTLLAVMCDDMGGSLVFMALFVFMRLLCFFAVVDVNPDSGACTCGVCGVW